MFGKIKEKILKKAFSYAFERYDVDHSGFLNRDEMASLLNDTFQLIGYPHKVSSIEARIAIKLFDDNGDGNIGKEEAYKATKDVMSRAGGFMGGDDGKSQSKVGAACPPDEEGVLTTKISNYEMPDEIDPSKLK